MRLMAVVLSLCLLAIGQRPALAASSWEPKQTYALIIGILEWKEKDLASFPKEARQDRALEKALKANGVPSDHIVFLEDKKATLAAIRTSMDKLATQAGPGSTLMIYFAGHGLRENGRTFLANYDVNTARTASTGLAVTEIGTRLARWQGSRLLLLADCCHSGAMSEVVRSMGGKGKAAACLTSSTASNTSTGNWTFTEAIVRALQGSGTVDRNRDRRLTFDEVDAHVHDEMKYGENQLTQGVRAGGFEADWQLTSVPSAQIVPASATQGRWGIGAYADCQSEGKWYRAKILNVKPGSFQVHYIGWEAKWDEWVTPNRLRAIATTRFAAGQRVQIESEDKWYAGKILRSAENFFHFVHYDDYDADSDEWVTDERLKPAGGR